ncbi:MAG: DNRLRE domain-containing protein [bacterium]
MFRNPQILRALGVAFAAAAALSLTLGCSDRDEAAPVGLGGLEPGRFEENVRAIFASPPITDTFAETVVNTGESKTLYAGYFESRQMRSLLRFTGIQSGIVREASLHLKISGRAGDAMPVSIALHRVNADWNEGTADATTLPAFDSLAVATTVSASTDTTLVAALPVPLVQAWIDSSSTNQGLLVAPANVSTTLRKFASTEADSGRPFLRIVRSAGGSNIVDTLFAEKDTYIARPDTTLDRRGANRLLAGRQNGFTLRSTFEFAFPAEIDDATTVNFAQLELRLDRAAFRLEDSIFVVAVHEVVSAVDSTAVVFVNSAETTTTITSSSDTLALNVTSLAGRMRIAKNARIKVLVRAQVETADTDHISIVSSEGAAADSLRPRLRLIVSSPAQAETLLAQPIREAETP